MKLIAAIFVGCVLAMLAAGATLIGGHGFLTAMGVYVIFGMIGTVLFALTDWTRLASLVLSDRLPGNERQLAFGEDARAETPRQ